MAGRGSTLAVSLLLLAAMSAACCTQARAGSPASPDGATEKPASLSSPVQGADEAPAQLAAGDVAAGDVAAGDVAAGQPREPAACLGEGATCNPLNDHCCPGYYCFGGLVPTCFRQP